MKKITRILSVALVAVMMLSVSAVSFAADDTTAYIPTRLAKLGLDVDLSDFVYPELSIKITNLGKIVIGKDDQGKPIYQEMSPEECPNPKTGKGYPVKTITEDSVAKYQFTEKPDWFGVVLSSLDGGWANIDIDDDGYGEFEIGELHRQPGMWGSTNKTRPWDKHNEWHNGGDYPYTAGKDYGDYNVTVNYHRDGSAYKLAVTFKDAADPFLTGMEGATVTVVYESVELLTDCYLDALEAWDNNGGRASDKPDAPYVPAPTPTSEWYLSHVEAVYPEGNYIIGIGADWRNDKKQNLASYRVAYAVSENQIYMITYSPNTTSILENKTGDKNLTETEINKVKYKVNGKYTDLSKQERSAANIPSQKVKDKLFVHHYTADTPIYGLFYKSRADWENGNVYAISGSGDKSLTKWFEYAEKDGKPTNTGKRVKAPKKSCTSFKSPRRLTK